MKNCAGCTTRNFLHGTPNATGIQKKVRVKILLGLTINKHFQILFLTPLAEVRPVLTPVAGSIFGPLLQTHISKREFKNEILRSALLDIQLTIFCVCGVDLFLPELEHL